MWQRDSIKWMTAIFCSLVMIVVLSSVFSISTLGTPSTAMAQAKKAPAAAAAAAKNTDEPVRINWLSWTYEALGIGYSLIFLSLSFTLVALLVMIAEHWLCDEQYHHPNG